ncbi:MULTISPECIES: 50S ribosomal protein L25/general stress protein Ctc [Brochothrix]|uniref:Large ribosomal subunit protein bL25 n=1 Tax=Brochothrix thermosphacta TaxID=2756 RepID=A0A1D2L6R4_BROTH|nr:MULTISPECIES: 50S ribosomal protein L25/general stress protein Ctc [Brochothrix]SLM93593.1 LSU ribosomal protein L25p [Brachybacterium faecium]ANZ95093.1 50S ribosomal protein L25/general stress protein Ctc [Brochothrix thermosphacta]ATF26022.1 50S ribosomal protein L25 [Brochothrix thermosphacta]ATH85362.1 50S ribosomal protein L25 [Brochothrix thermosphacta]MBR5525802.1 50S ribosomal protein L25/general stress protein Ctc [Brochothrix sp.]
MTIELKTRPRSLENHSEAKSIRRAGAVPAVVYGYGIKNTNVAVDEIDLIKALRENGRNAVLTLELGGKKTNVILHQYQKHPLNGELVHADFLAVNMKEELETEVAIRLVGEPKDKAGVLEQVLYNVLVSATPSNVPESLEIDISKLTIGDVITVADLTTAKEYAILADAEDVVAILQAPQKLEEATDEVAEAAEPEVINGGEEKE